MRPIRSMAAAAAAVALLAAVASGAAAAAEEPPPCPSLQLPPVGVPHARDALKRDGRLLVVALGSSTTQSVAASDSGHSYPAVLQAALAGALPNAHVSVINRGIGGQDAAEEVARLEADAVAIRPSLVIWQVGANGVLRRSDPDIFKRLVTTGVKRLQQAGADVVLMDNQRAPRILALPDHAKLEQALADVAVATGASLFSRAALMDGWKRDGQPYEAFISADGLHHNDLGYRCVAQALAASVIAGLNQPVVAPPAPNLAARFTAGARRLLLGSSPASPGPASPSPASPNPVSPSPASR